MIIYKTTNLLNNLIYIGKDSKNNDKYLGSGIILKKAISKYGTKYFKKEILETCNSKDELNKREIYWIDLFKSTDRKIGYNIAKGGGGGDTISLHPDNSKIRLKISKANTGKLIGYKHTEETKKKFSLAHKGQIQSEESNKKRSEKVKGIPRPWKKDRIVSQETRLKISDTNKGIFNGMYNKKHTAESILKMKNQKIGNKNPFYNRTHSEEVKKIISTKLKGRIRTDEHKNNLSIALKGKIPHNRKKVMINNVIYESVAEAADKLNVKYSEIRRKLNSTKFKNYIILCKIN